MFETFMKNAASFFCFCIRNRIYTNLVQFGFSKQMYYGFQFVIEFYLTDWQKHDVWPERLQQRVVGSLQQKCYIRT